MVSHDRTPMRPPRAYAVSGVLSGAACKSPHQNGHDRAWPSKKSEFRQVLPVEGRPLCRPFGAQKQQNGAQKHQIWLKNIKFSHFRPVFRLFRPRKGYFWPEMLKIAFLAKKGPNRSKEGQTRFGQGKLFIIAVSAKFFKRLGPFWFPLRKEYITDHRLSTGLLDYSRIAELWVKRGGGELGKSRSQYSIFNFNIQFRIQNCT